MKNKSDFEFILKSIMDESRSVEIVNLSSSFSNAYEITVYTEETHFHLQGNSLRELVGRAHKVLQDKKQKQ